MPTHFEVKLAKSNFVHSQIYKFGDFEINTLDEVLRKNGEKVGLNRRAFHVLRLLIERAGHVVSKQEFFDTVWGDTFVEDNSLTVAMTTLRKVLGDDARNPKYIENLPRKGYRFMGEVTIAEQPAFNVSQNTVAASPPSLPGPGVVKRLSIFITILFVCLLFLAGILAFYRFGSTSSMISSSQNQIDSIAVLPFHNDDPETQYLSDGLADSLIDSLADVPALRVIDRQSAFQYKDKELNTFAIAIDLKVQAVVTGSVFHNGDSITINAKLMETPSGRELWSKQYVRSLTEGLILQRQITSDISGVLGQRNIRPFISKGGTDNREAYHLYLKGRHYWNKRTTIDINRARDLFQQAIDIDPTFALAFIGLARCYSQMNLDPSPSNTERLALVKGAAQRALEIDSSLGEAYSVMALSETYLQYDLANAEKHHSQAIKLSPNDPTAHHWYAEFLAMQGQFEQSFREYDAALDRDPISFAIMTDRAITFYYARQFDRAIEEFEKLRGIHQAYERIDEFLIPLYEAKGMFAEAIRSRRTLYTHQQKSGQMTTDQLALVNARLDKVAVSLHSSGAEGYWRGMINFEIEQGNGSASKWYLAMCYSKLGETEKVFPLLEQSIKKYDGSILWMKVAPDFDNVRDDPRFIDAMHRVGFH